MSSNIIEKKYLGLTPSLQDLIKIVTLIDDAQSRSKIMQICAKAKIKDSSNRGYTTVSVGKALEELKTQGLIKKNLDQKYDTLPNAFDYVLRKVLKDKRLSDFRKSVFEIFPGIHSKGYYKQPQSILRDICFAIYANDYKSFNDGIQYLLERYDFDLENLFNKYFVDRFGKENLHTLAPEFQLDYYQAYLDKSIMGLENTSEIINSIANIKSKLSNADATYVSHYLSLNAIFKGDWATVLKLWSGQENLEAWSFLGWVNFAQGHNKKAITYYEAALKAHRKVEGSKKAFFRNYHGVIYILALLKDDNIKHLPLIKKYIREVFSNGITNTHLILGSLIEALQNNPERAQELFSQEYIYYSIDGLMYLYVQYWSQTFAPNWENYAHTLHHKSIKNGHYWVAYNIAALMQKISSDKSAFYKKSMLELSPYVDKVPSLMGVITIREPWEIALQALNAVNSTSARVSQETRLVWLIDFENERLQPKIQKINKSGKWSKGRNAALTKLAHGEITEATPHDHRIIGTLSRDYGWYGSNSYGFHDIARTFKALIGHPLLFLYKSPDIACELLKGSPELIIKETKDGFEISSSIKLNAYGYTIIRETPTRYKYIDVTPEQEQLGQLIGSRKLIIPKKGKKKLEKTLANLSSIIPLQSDLDYLDDTTPSLEADTRIYIHLLPVGDGFHVEFFVKPFQSAPPYYKPGEGASKVIGLVEGIRSQTQRDLLAEKKAAKKIKNACPSLLENKAKNAIWSLDNPMDCLMLLRDLEPLKLDNLIVVEWPKGEKIKIKQHLSFDNLKLSIQRENDWFGISGKIHVNENLVLDMRQLLNMMQEQKSEFIQLDDGQFLALSSQLKKQLKKIHNYSDEKGNVHPLAGFALDDLTDQIQDIEIDTAWTEHIDQLKTIEKKKYRVPKTLKATLRPYQKEGFQWLSKLSDWGVGACLADDMGLGKTIQALAVILQRSKNGPTLVVAPASVCRNWIKEIEKFAPSLTPILFSESNRETTIQKAKKGQVLISTYGLLQTESELFASTQFSTIVLDEAQAIKNSSAKRSKAAMKLNGDFKIITTGTPIENHLSELWNLFRFINPGLLGSMKSFRERFAIPIEKDRDVETQEQLQMLIRPFILRRHKKDVLKELPEKTEVILSVDLSEEEQAFYEALRREAVDNLENNQEDQAGTKHLKVLAQITRLRQACCNPKLVNATTKVKSSKLNLFGKVLSELLENGHKALVFSQFVGHLKLIEDYIKSKKIPYQYLDGQTPTKKRQERIDAFQNGDGSVFLISLKAGGTGLNLTAADYVIHMDPWWNPAVEDQASDRAHRIGQKRPVTVYRLITENTIEEKIIKLHENKRDLADSLLKGTDASSKISTTDLLNLIKQGNH